MMKEILMDRIIMEMVPTLDDNTVHKLKNAIVKAFYDVEVMARKNEIRLQHNANDRLLDMFKISKKVEQLADSTIYQYVKATKKFLDFFNKNFDQITIEDIRYYFAVLMKQGKNSAVSLNNTRKFIKSFYTWCIENDYMDKNPFMKLKAIKAGEKSKEILTDEETADMGNVCKTLQERVLVSFLSDTGVRVSECAGIKVQDINFSTGMVEIYARKTRTYRRVYVSDKCLGLITEYLTHKGIKEFLHCPGLLFSSINREQISRQSIERIIKRIGRNAGIEKHCTVHLFRRTLASKLYRGGMPIENIAKLLGHRNSSTTIKYYLVIDETNLRAEYYKSLGMNA